MVQLQFSIELHYNVVSAPSDFILNIQAAKTSHQRVLQEDTSFNQPVTAKFETDWATGTRLMQFEADPGPLHVRYDAIVEIEHHRARPEHLSEQRAARLPTRVLPYLYPSRYCPTDQFFSIAIQEFDRLPPGYERVIAIQEWVRKRTKFQIGTSDSGTSAIDTMKSQSGVCRDFAHLMIALCRALNLPARFVTGIDYGADPSLGPTDFHAYVEVFIGNRWYLFDPTGISPPMGLVRIGTGRDAADTSFATIFGAVQSTMPIVTIDAIEDRSKGYQLPAYVKDALSTQQ